MQKLEQTLLLEIGETRKVTRTHFKQPIESLSLRYQKMFIENSSFQLKSQRVSR